MGKYNLKTEYYKGYKIEFKYYQHNGLINVNINGQLLMNTCLGNKAWFYTKKQAFESVKKIIDNNDIKNNISYEKFEKTRKSWGMDY